MTKESFFPCRKGYNLLLGYYDRRHSTSDKPNRAFNKDRIIEPHSEKGIKENIAMTTQFILNLE